MKQELEATHNALITLAYEAEEDNAAVDLDSESLEEMAPQEAASELLSVLQTMLEDEDTSEEEQAIAQEFIFDLHEDTINLDNILDEIEDAFDI